MKKLFYQGIFWRGLNYISVFIVTIVIARLFKPGESGSINYLVNNLAILILITSFNLETALGYFSAKSEIAPGELVSSTLVMVVVSSLLNAAIIRWVIVPHDTSLWLPCVMYCTGVILMNYFSGLYFSHFNYITPNIMVMLVNACIIILCLWKPGQLTGEGGKNFIVFYFSSFLVSGLFIAISYMFLYNRALQWPAAVTFKNLFRYAGMALVANVVFFLVYRVDYWFVHRNCTSDQLGNYIQVSKLAQIFMLLPGILAGVVFTRTAKDGQVASVSLLQTLSRLLVVSYGLILVVLVFAGWWLFPFVYGTGFTLMYIPFLMLVPGIISLATLTLVTAFNAGQHRLAMNLKGAVVALLVIVAGNSLLSAQFGIYAAALVSSAGYISYQLYIMYHIKPFIHGARVRDFFIPARKDFRILKNIFTGNNAGADDQ